MAYLMLTLPLWISNKLAPDHGGNIDFMLRLFGKDDLSKKLLIDHRFCRFDRLRWTKRYHSYTDCNASEVMEHTCGYGGSLLTQFYVFGSQHLDRYRTWNMKVAAAAHVFDDFVDQKEDKQTERLNYFNDLPVSEEYDIHYWIREMSAARRFFEEKNDTAMVQFIDGSCTIPSLFHKELRDILFADETNFRNMTPKWIQWLNGKLENNN